MILLDLRYDSGENEVVLLKIGAIVLDLCFDKFLAKGFGPKQLLTCF